MNIASEGKTTKTFDLIDPPNVNNAEILESPIISPIKKHLHSPSKLTNKYLSIKQEESEMSDAESLAR